MHVQRGPPGKISQTNLTIKMCVYPANREHSENFQVHRELKFQNEIYEQTFIWEVTGNVNCYFKNVLKMFCKLNREGV